MSPNLHIQLARFRQDELAARAHDAHELQAAAGRPPHGLRYRVSQAIAALGVGLFIATAAVTGAQASPHTAQAGRRLSASQLASDIRALEAKGYTPWQCTPKGTLLRNSRGQFQTISW